MGHVEIILPAVSDDEVSAGLRRLTRTIAAKGLAEKSMGLLGGEDGYGCDYENDVFAMFPFYWGDCECGREEAETAWSESHPHLPTCYQTELQRRWDEPGVRRLDVAPQLAKEWGLPQHGCAIHCTCGHDKKWSAWSKSHPHDPSCGVVKANFLHKRSGSTVCWYKYIGRSMDVDIRGEWISILADCLRSLESEAA